MRKILMLIIILFIFINCNEVKKKNEVSTTKTDVEVHHNETNHKEVEQNDNQQNDEQYENVKVLFEQKCSKCHSLDRVNNLEQDKEGWVKTINEMKKYGAEVNENEVDKIAEYLAEN